MTWSYPAKKISLGDAPLWPNLITLDAAVGVVEPVATILACIGIVRQIGCVGSGKDLVTTHKTQDWTESSCPYEECVAIGAILNSPYLVDGDRCERERLWPRTVFGKQ